MTSQTKFQVRLGGSPAGAKVSRFRALTLVALLAAGGAIAGLAQEGSNSGKPAAAEAAQSADNLARTAGGAKVVGHYSVHSMVELGGRFAEKSGSDAMWATMVNQTTGARVLGQSTEMHTLDPHKTPFFDTLSTSSFGYGGDPYDVSTLKLSKGKWYDFMGTFRRDRNYFDYGLLANSLLTSATPATPALVPEPGTLHLYNTVRRNTNTLLTLLPLSIVSFRAGYNRNTNEGPTYSTLHGGGDVQLAQWFRTGLSTFVGGVDVKVAKRTTLSYDQYYALFKGDTMFHLAPTPFTLSNGTPVSLGVNVLTGPTVTCGSGAHKAQNVVNGVANPFCSSTVQESMTAPTRTSFPTEQFRFSSRYFENVAMNGRLTYTGDITNINSFNETFMGIGRAGSCPGGGPCVLRQSVLTGGGPSGRYAHNKRISVTGDYRVEADLGKYFSLSDAVVFWSFRIPTLSNFNQTLVTGPTATTSELTPLTSSTLTSTTTNTIDTHYLSQRNLGNTILASVNVTSQAKISAGWRINDRQIGVDTDPILDWHQNWLLLGGVITASPMVRVSANYEMMGSQSANSTTTPSNTYTREAPDKIYHFRVRALIKPNKWLNFAVASNDYSAKNDDPQVNHQEHSREQSISAQVIASSTLSFDATYGHGDQYSVTDLCYVLVPTANAAAPAGATNRAGTCANTTLGASTPDYLGNGYYSAPSNFFTGDINFSSKYFDVNAGARVNSVNGAAEMLNPYQEPGSLESTVLSPYADLLVRIAPQWSWHGNWNHQSYVEGGPVGPGLAARNFHGDIYTLGVRYEF
jgi:hypothetical protein